MSVFSWIYGEKQKLNQVKSKQCHKHENNKTFKDILTTLVVGLPPPCPALVSTRIKRGFVCKKYGTYHFIFIIWVTISKAAVNDIRRNLLTYISLSLSLSLSLSHTRARARVHAQIGREETCSTMAIIYWITWCHNPVLCNLKLLANNGTVSKNTTGPCSDSQANQPQCS